MRNLLSSHSYDIWSDTVRGVACIDHFTRQAEIPSTFSPPYYKVCLGGDSKWLTTLTTTNTSGDQRQVKVEAETRAEMVYNILCDVSGSAPTYDSFIRWYSYPSQSITMSTLAGNLELQRQLLPLQNHVDRQLYNNRVQCVLEVFCSINLVCSIMNIIYIVICNNVCNINQCFQSKSTQSWFNYGSKNLILGPNSHVPVISKIECWVSESELNIYYHCNSRQTLNYLLCILLCDAICQLSDDSNLLHFSGCFCSTQRLGRVKTLQLCC